MNLSTINPLLYWVDSYKISHINFEVSGVKEVYSNFTPRFDKYMRESLGSQYDGKYVVFGIQWMLMRMNEMFNKGFFERDKKEVMDEMKEVLTAYIGQTKYDHFEKLHDLGYLPIEIKSLDEGSVVDVGIPFLTIKNTHPDFSWLTNYLETGMSMDLWKQLTVATIGRSYKMVSEKYSKLTCGNTMVGFQNHDFHSRGASGFESCAINGVAFLLSTLGTDNAAALWAAKKFYNSDNRIFSLASSVSAGEHSVTVLGINHEKYLAGDSISNLDAEKLYLKSVLNEKFQFGIVSYVADSYDYYGLLEHVLPELKDDIMKREGKLVIRGDSGDPADVICGKVKDLLHFESKDEARDTLGDHAWEFFNDNCDADGYCNEVDYTISIKGIIYNVSFSADITTERGGWSDNDYYIVEEISDAQFDIIKLTVEDIGTIEHLWNVFGGTINEQGYKVLDEHIGMIYGDGITPQRQEEILSRLERKGFASSNIVFGVGSYTLNTVSRDFLGMAIKATNAKVEIDGEIVSLPLVKDPKTDRSKKSAKGLIYVYEEDGVIKFKDDVSEELEGGGLLTTAFKDGVIYKSPTVFDIRTKMYGND